MITLVALAHVLSAPIELPPAVTPRDCVIRYVGQPALHYVHEHDTSPRLVCITVFNTWWQLQLKPTERSK